MKNILSKFTTVSVFFALACNADVRLIDRHTQSGADLPAIRIIDTQLAETTNNGKTANPAAKATSTDPYEPADTPASGELPWGSKLCAKSATICVRPYAVYEKDDDLEIRWEIWGTGDRYITDGNLQILWHISNANGNSRRGHGCNNGIPDLSSEYSQGFGHTSMTCFSRIKEKPSLLTLELNDHGIGQSFIIETGDPLESLMEWSYFKHAQEFVMGEELLIGAARVIIEKIDLLDDHLVANVKIAAPENGNLLVASPHWIMAGKRLAFSAVDDSGKRYGWDKAKMQAYNTIKGGKLAPGLEQAGAVVLNKPPAESALLITYGNHVVEDDAKIIRLTAE